MKQVLEGLAGVRKVTMRFDDREYDVEYDSPPATPDTIRGAVQQAGFTAEVREQ